MKLQEFDTWHFQVVSGKGRPRNVSSCLDSRTLSWSGSACSLFLMMENSAYGNIEVRFGLHVLCFELVLMFVLSALLSKMAALKKSTPPTQDGIIQSCVIYNRCSSGLFFKAFPISEFRSPQENVFHFLTFLFILSAFSYCILGQLLLVITLVMQNRLPPFFFIISLS